MNQGKLEAVKQDMARVNINILGISELGWIGMGAQLPRLKSQGQKQGTAHVPCK